MKVLHLGVPIPFSGFGSIARSAHRWIPLTNLNLARNAGLSSILLVRANELAKADASRTWLNGTPNRNTGTAQGDPKCPVRRLAVGLGAPELGGLLPGQLLQALRVPFTSLTLAALSVSVK